MSNLVYNHSGAKVIEVGKHWTVFVHPEYITATYNGKAYKQYNLKPSTHIPHDVSASELRAIVKQSQV